MNFGIDGFVVWKQGLREAPIRTLGAHIRTFFVDRISESALETDLRRVERGIERVFNIQLEIAAVAELWTKSRLLTFAADLLGVASVRPFYTQAILKYPSSPEDAHGVVGWHKDFAYWQGVETPRMVTAWIPFSPITKMTGGLLYRRGSHSNRSDMAKGFNNTDLGPVDMMCDIVAPELSVGDVIFHHCLTTHASMANRGNVPRLALAVHLLDSDLAPVDLAHCHHSLAFLRGLDPSLAH